MDRRQNHQLQPEGKQEERKEDEEQVIELHPFQQISQLIARYSENRHNLGAMNNKPVVNSLWHGLLQKELNEKFSNNTQNHQIDSSNHNCSSSSNSSPSININNDMRGVIRYVD